jgi:hypothetical protein
MLRVTIYTDETLKEAGEGSLSEVHDPLEIDGDYVSLVNGSTYGPPPLIAPTARAKDDDPRAAVGETVIYINTARVPAFEITRVSD